MFCPRCSQQQLPGEGRFCSRCGFQLAAVSQLVRTDGAVFAPPPQYLRRERLPLVKRQELRAGAKLIFTSFFSVVPTFILAVVVDSAAPLILPVIAFLVGLAQIIYYFLFGETILPLKKQPSPENNEYQYRPNYQEAHGGLPYSNVGPNSLTTAELARPFGTSGRTTNYFDGR